MNLRYSGVFDVSGTRSMRLSSRQIFGEYGGNLQNPTESFRGFLVAPKGKKIFQVDQAGAEALVVAMLTEPGNYRQLFQVKIKPHTYLALNIFTDRFRGEYPRDRYQFRTPLELSQLPEWPELNATITANSDRGSPYDIGKKVAHARAYAMGPNTFRLNVLKESQGSIVLTFAEAKAFLAMYEKLFPEVIEWQAAIEQQVAQTRILHNLFNYPRTFHGRWSAALVREALSYIPQSTIGCLTSIVFTEMSDLGHDMLVNAHDAVVGQDNDETVEDTCRLAKKLFARPLVSPRGETFHMGADAMIGPSWCKSEMRKVK